MSALAGGQKFLSRARQQKTFEIRKERINIGVCKKKKVKLNVKSSNHLIMADGCGEDDIPKGIRNKSGKKSNDTDEDNDQDDETAEPDLGISGERKFQKKGPEHIAGTINGLQRREDNPFSFKHFLKRDSSSNFHRTGARPKVYVPPESLDRENSPPADRDVDGGPFDCSTGPRHAGTPELTSVLPDFVQDHLVVEQCYLGHSVSSKSPQLAVDFDNLPDFARDECQSRRWDEPESIPPDLADAGTSPLDLPQEPSGGLPFDLPLTTGGGGLVPATGSQGGEPGKSKRLPDFLSDGPILSDRQDASQSSNGTSSVDMVSDSSDHTHQRLTLENERLRRELEGSRRQLSEQARRVQVLEKELLILRSKEHEETTTLEKAIEQVEDNLKRTTKRAVTAESTVSKLKQEIKMLTWELSSLQQENDRLRTGDAGASGPYLVPSERQSQRLAQDLRVAAGTAEHSLRQLLSGVGNLRIIADTIENMHKIQDRSEDFLRDCEDGAGPAL
ncbi:endosome-associated-trafficking regulator 1 [Bacillus rossius redtenbacheri]|uniref:endosome-associated-trafficking regulator 1 n=1 Tax=Bacillus rossius redtenbacheri TaxID=93214 RepID=UPI002FDDC634